MNRVIDRRAVFFLIAAVASLLTLIITPEKLRWVGWGLAAVYVVLAILSHLDFRSRIKER